MSESVKLTTIDHYFSADRYVPLTFLFSFDSFLETSRLQASLDETLKAYWPMKGELRETDKSQLAIIQTDRPVLIQEQNISAEDFKECKGFRSLKYAREACNDSSKGALASVWLFKSEHYSFLLISISHVLTDGIGFFKFIHHWVNLHSGSACEVVSHDRPRFQKILSELPFDAREISLSKGMLSSRGLNEVDTNRAGPDSVIGIDQIIYAKADILKEKAPGIRTFNYIASKLLKKRFAKFDDHSRVKLVIPVNLRSILDAPENYFGNAVIPHHLYLEVSEVKNLSLNELASLIQERTKVLDRKEYGNKFHLGDFIRKVKGYRALQNTSLSDENTLLITDLRSVPYRKFFFDQSQCISMSLLSRYRNTAGLFFDGSNYIIHQSAKIEESL